MPIPTNINLYLLLALHMCAIAFVCAQNIISIAVYPRAHTHTHTHDECLRTNLVQHSQDPATRRTTHAEKVSCMPYVECLFSPCSHMFAVCSKKGSCVIPYIAAYCFPPNVYLSA